MIDQPSTELDPEVLEKFEAEFSSESDRYYAAVETLKAVISGGIIEPEPAARTVIGEMVGALLESGQTKHQVAALLRRVARGFS